MTSREPQLVALVAAAPATSAADRERLRPVVERLAGERRGVALATCHRVELYAGPAGATTLPTRPLADLPGGAVVLRGRAAASHAISVAIGLESAVVGEDQILHQLRGAVGAARARSPLEPDLESLFATALRTGRTARSWRTGPPRSLADVALDRASELGARIAGGTVLVVGTGEMGRLAARAARARGAAVRVAGRRPGRAAELARSVGGQAVPIDPGASVAAAGVVVVALDGAWAIGSETVAALGRGPLVVDLSQPAAVPAAVRPMGSIGLDELAAGFRDDPATAALRRRLEALREAGLAEFEAWLDRRSTAGAVRSLADRIEGDRRAALESLWRRRPDLGPDDRADIDALTRHLAERLFREPFERLGRDPDGRRERAARELFGL